MRSFLINSVISKIDSSNKMLLTLNILSVMYVEDVITTMIGPGTISNNVHTTPIIKISSRTVDLETIPTQGEMVRIGTLALKIVHFVNFVRKLVMYLRATGVIQDLKQTQIRMLI